MMAVQSAAIHMGLMSHLNETEFVRSSAELEAALKPLMVEKNSQQKQEDEDAANRGKCWVFKNRQCRKRFIEDIKS